MCCCVVVVCVACGVVDGAGENLPAAVCTVLTGQNHSLPIKIMNNNLITRVYLIVSEWFSISALANPSHVTGLCMNAI